MGVDRMPAYVGGRTDPRDELLLTVNRSPTCPNSSKDNLVRLTKYTSEWDDCQPGGDGRQHTTGVRRCDFSRLAGMGRYDQEQRKLLQRTRETTHAKVCCNDLARQRHGCRSEKEARAVAVTMNEDRGGVLFVRSNGFSHSDGKALMVADELTGQSSFWCRGCASPGAEAQGQGAVPPATRLQALSCVLLDGFIPRLSCHTS